MIALSPSAIAHAARERRTARPTRETIAIGLFTAAVLVIGTATTSQFLTSENVLLVVRAAAIIGIVALGMTFVTVSGNMVSLSVEQTATLSGIILALMLSRGWPLLAGLVTVLVLAGLIGALQGTIVSLGLNPIVTTLAAGAILGSIASTIGGRTIKRGGDGAAWIGQSQPLGVPTPSLVFVVLAIAGSIVFARTSLGRLTLLVGANRRAAAASGLSPARATVAAFTLSAAAAGLVAIIQTTQLGQANLEQFSGLNFEAISAVLIGGIALQGGEGSLVRTAWGALFIATLENLAALRGYGEGVRLLVEGLVLLLAVSIFALTKRGP